MNMLMLANSQVTITSLDIAALTGKEHSHVMRDCRVMLGALGIPDESKMGFVERINNLGFSVRDPHYILTKDEALCLVSGYDIPIRMKIVKRLRELEEAQAKPLTTMQMIAAMATAIDAQDQKLLALEAEQKAQAEKLAALSASTKAVIDQSDYFSVMGYCHLVGTSMSLSSASVHSRALGILAKRYGMERHEVADPRFGKVFTYPKALLADYFAGKLLK